MKIAITSTGLDKTNEIDLTFGRCHSFAIYDTETKTYEFEKNENNNANQGAGIASAQFMISKKVDVVVTGNLGKKAFQVLSDNNIAGYTTQQTSVEKALLAHEENALKKIEHAKN